MSELEYAAVAREQAALRRVATLVARGAAPDEVFALVSREVGQLVAADVTSLLRFDPGDLLTLVAAWSTSGTAFPIGESRPLDDQVRALRESGRPHRWGLGGTPMRGPFIEEARALGITAAIGVPIVVDGRVWGVCFTSSTSDRPFPEDVAARISGFMELVATAISNAEARADVRMLVSERAARERVARLVARDVPLTDLFAEVTAEVGRLLGADIAGMMRYVGNDQIEAVATWIAVGEHPDVSGQWPIESNSLAVDLLRTRKPARVNSWDDARGAVASVLRDMMGVRSSVASPIIVDDQVWGGLTVHSTQGVLAPDVDARLESFAELVATSISNAEARAEARRLAEEQVALRRVATLVARESPAEEVLATVAEEVGRILSVDETRIVRYEDDDEATVVAGWGRVADEAPVGLRLEIGGDNVSTMVARTGHSARKDFYDHATGQAGHIAREVGVRSAIGAPIAVGGRVWGVILAASLSAERLPADAESRMAEFAELVATAISNLETRAHLAASRARLVAAGDAERRRVVRDLHDGAQQRLVHTIVTLRRAESELVAGSARASELLSEAIEHAQRATEELRELAHGIMPAMLTRGGLRVAVESLASRSRIPIRIDVPEDRYPAEVEATAYFVVAEALTNVAKHAEATAVSVYSCVDAGALRIEVRDDGRGGASADGSGVVGLADRVAALNGRLRIDSREGAGTVLAAEIPLPRT